MSSLEIVLSIFTVLLIIYGSIMTTLNYRRNRGKLDVSTIFMITSVHVKDSKNFWRMVHIVNSGSRAIVVESVGITLTYSNEADVEISVDSEDLPKRLEEGESFNTFTIDESFDSVNIKYCWTKDTTGKIWKSGRNPFVQK